MSKSSRSSILVLEPRCGFRSFESFCLSLCRLSLRVDAVLKFGVDDSEVTLGGEARAHGFVAVVAGDGDAVPLLLAELQGSENALAVAPVVDIDAPATVHEGDARVSEDRSLPGVVDLAAMNRSGIVCDTPGPGRVVACALHALRLVSPVPPLLGQMRVLALPVPLFEIGIRPEALPQRVAFPCLPLG